MEGIVEDLMKKNYIGIANSFHDGSIAIVNSEGKVVFAEAAERYLQSKRSINAPVDQFIRSGKLIEKYCEPGAELVVANTWSEDALDLTNKQIRNLEEKEKAWNSDSNNIPELALDKLALNKFVMESQRTSLLLANKTLSYELSVNDKWKKNSNFTVKKYNHHLSHAATACFTSSFSEGACAILDGYGEKTAVESYIYKDGKITNVNSGKTQTKFGASIGMFYMTICDVCGFGFLRGEEWKVMGLAAYGKFNSTYYNIMKPMIKINDLNLEYCDPYKFNKNMYKLYSYKRKKGQNALELADLAYTGQLVFSELIYEYLNNLYNRVKMDNLILGGGNFLNSWTNGEIERNTPFKNVYIFSAPGDDGNSIGAALLAYYEDNLGSKPPKAFQSPYLGSEISNEDIENFLKFGGYNLHVKNYKGNVHVRAAELLAKGKIIGWIQGRAEFGPRALGNRSILADPRMKDCKEKINTRVKFREEFRPFAPAILHEYGDKYFVDYVETPYMERTLRFKDEVIDIVPGVVHENKTGRLQTVKREWNEKFYLLLSEFNKITNVPILLNTSFNVMGKPIVHSFEDAIAVFFTSGLDALVIGDVVIEKPEYNK